MPAAGPLDGRPACGPRGPDPAQAGELFFVPPQQYTSQNPCESVGPLGIEDANFKLIAYIHPHPIFGPDTNQQPDVYPANCGPGKAGRRYTRGLSNEDWDTINNVLRVPGFIIDKQYIQFVPRNSLKSMSSVRTYPWNASQCKW